MQYDKKSPYLNFRSLRDMIAKSKRAEVILANDDLADLIEPVTPANPIGEDPPVEAMGYLATADGRIWARMAVQSEVQEVFGVDAVGPMESAFLALRVAQMPDIEASAIAAQRDAVQLLASLREIAQPLSRGLSVPQRTIAAAVSLIDRIDAERQAAFEEKARRDAELIVERRKVRLGG